MTHKQIVNDEYTNIPTYNLVTAIREADTLEKAENILRLQLDNIFRNQKPYGYIVSSSKTQSVLTKEEAVKQSEWYNRFKPQHVEESYVIPLCVMKE